MVRPENHLINRLAKESLQPGFALADAGLELGVAYFEAGIGNDGRAAVPLGRKLRSVRSLAFLMIRFRCK